MSVTDRSSPAMNSRMWRRRGSAIALKGSEVVEARAMRSLYIPIWEYVKLAADGGPPNVHRREQIAAAYP